MSNNTSLVTSQWLADNLVDPNIRILDASWHFPDSPRKAKAEFDDGHIPGALFFDIDEVADVDIPLPHMMPKNEKMSSRVRAMGISATSHVIVYDNSDFGTAARVWFMFKSCGHDNVSILDGGLQKWKSDGNPTTTETGSWSSSHFSANLDPDKVCDMAHVERNIDSQAAQLVDARSSGRFVGTAPEPRADCRSGHIPGSFNVPFTGLLNENRTYVSNDEIRRVFEKGGVDLSKPIITSCGSGVSACVLLFALAQIGHRENALYDGSWAQWGADADTPVVL